MNSTPKSHFRTSLSVRIWASGVSAFATCRVATRYLARVATRHVARAKALLKIKQRRHGRGNGGRREEPRFGFIHGPVLLQAIDEAPIIRGPPSDLCEQPPGFLAGVGPETAAGVVEVLTDEHRGREVRDPLRERVRVLD